MATPALCEFEQQRLERIALNKKMIQELGIDSAVADLELGKPPKPERKARAPKQLSQCDEVVPKREGLREKAKVNYAEIDHVPGLPRAVRPRTARTLDEEEVEKLREKNGILLGENETDSQAAKASRGPIDSGKGVRIQGGKVYDSAFGVTCHWCRQKTLEDHVTCSHPSCGKGRRMPTSFCKNCLKNRHGEDCDQAYQSGQWVCPGCRGSCGRGCITCCNCGPCRKKAGLEPTHQIVKSAREAGFDNVHDFLVHMVTGESQDQIQARKQTQEWGKWLSVDITAMKDGAGVDATEAPASKPEEEQEAAGPASRADQAPASTSAPQPKGRKGGKAAKSKAENTPAAEEEAEPVPDVVRAQLQGEGLKAFFPSVKNYATGKAAGSKKGGAKRKAEEEAVPVPAEEPVQEEVEASQAVDGCAKQLSRKQRILMSMGLGLEGPEAMAA